MLVSRVATKGGCCASDLVQRTQDLRVAPSAMLIIPASGQVAVEEVVRQRPLSVDPERREASSSMVLQSQTLVRSSGRSLPTVGDSNFKGTDLVCLEDEELLALCTCSVTDAEEIRRTLSMLGLTFCDD